MLDIYSKGAYPADALSNFAAHAFAMDGVQIASMEGFLQGLKYRSPERQRQVCALTGKAAKLAGRHRYLWRLTRRIWWQGRSLHLYSDDFRRLVDRAYDALYVQNADFRRALQAAGDEPLCHSIGKSRADKTILTEYQFISQLERLRHEHHTNDSDPAQLPGNLSAGAGSAG